MKKLVPVLLIALLSCGSTGGRSAGGRHGDAAQNGLDRRGAQITCQIVVERPQSQEVKVSMLVQGTDESRVDMVMPTWAPHEMGRRGDFARGVRDVSARGPGGKGLRMERVQANRWRVHNRGEDFVFSYTVRADGTAPGMSLVSDELVILHPASVCMFVDGWRKSPVTLYVSVPGRRDWQCSAGLPKGDGPGRFLAQDYGELAECVIVAGDFDEHILTRNDDQQQVRVLVSPAGLSLSSTLARGTEELLKRAAESAKGEPGRDDLLVTFFFNLGPRHELAQAGPRFMAVGIEARPSEQAARRSLGLLAGLIPRWQWRGALVRHDATAVDFDRLPADDMAWLPTALGRWLGRRLLARTGLMTEQQLRRACSDIINQVESDPDKRSLSLLATSENIPFASSDTWKARGEALFLLLDLALIGSSGGESDIHELARTLGGLKAPITQEGFLSACAKTGGRDLELLAQRLLSETGPRPWKKLGAETGFVIEASEGRQAQLGAVLDGHRVVRVTRGSAAAKAGLQSGDRIVRFAGRRADAGLEERLATFPPRTNTTITVERRGSLVTLPLRLVEIRRGRFRFDEGRSELKHLRDIFYGRNKTP